MEKNVQIFQNIFQFSKFTFNPFFKFDELFNSEKSTFSTPSMIKSYPVGFVLLYYYIVLESQQSHPVIFGARAQKDLTFCFYQQGERV